MSHLIVVRGPSGVGKSCLVRALARDPKLDVEYLISDRFTYYACEAWEATLDFRKLGLVAGEILDKHKRDVIVESCFRDEGWIRAFLEAARQKVSGVQPVVIRLDAHDIRTIINRCRTRPDKLPGDAERQLDIPYCEFPGEFHLFTDDLSEQEILSRSLEYLRPRVCARA